jgi:hypothetical protein
MKWDLVINFWPDPSIFKFLFSNKTFISSFSVCLQKDPCNISIWKDYSTKILQYFIYYSIKNQLPSLIL